MTPIVDAIPSLAGLPRRDTFGAEAPAKTLLAEVRAPVDRLPVRAAA